MAKFYPVGAKTYNLGSSISSTATTILLSSFLEPVTGIPYTMVLLNTDIVFATISPKTTSSEFISFTGITQNANGTATLTGVVRGLAKKYPFTTDVAYKLPHSGQSQFILSDAPQVFVEYPAKINNEIISGDWDFTGQVTFDNFPITPSNTPATTTVLGVVKTSVAPASALSPIAVETTDPRVPVAYAVDSVGTDSYAITPSPAITAYAAGQVFTFKAGTANTGAATLNVNGLGAKTIKKNVSADVNTGDILANQIVLVEYDGTNMQLLSNTPNSVPTIQVFSTLTTSKGDTTTQFDITFIGGSTFRYTYDTTGTDPIINATTMPVGIPVLIESGAMAAGNTGSFIVTGSGSNYFEVTNSAGTGESNKTLSGGYLRIPTAQTYIKPNGVSYIIVEVQGAGGAGSAGGNGGGGGGYAKKKIAASSVATTETLYVGSGGPGTNVYSTVGGLASVFSSSIVALGGSSTVSTSVPAPGGIATGGDVNILGGSGTLSSAATGANFGGMGGGSFLGFGGPMTNHANANAGGTNGNDGAGYGGGGSGPAFGSSGTPSSGTGANGIIIVTEFY